MKRRDIIKAATGAATVAAMGSAQAQTQNETETTTTEDDEPDSAVRQIDPVTRIRDYRYNGGIFFVELESRAVSTVTISEQVGADSAGSGRFNIRQVRVTPGSPVEVRIRAEMVDSKAIITLTTNRSIQNGYGTYLQAGNGFELFDGPASWRNTAIASLGTFAGTAWGTKRYKESKEDEMERKQMEELE